MVGARNIISDKKCDFLKLTSLMPNLLLKQQESIIILHKKYLRSYERGENSTNNGKYELNEGS